ncbi:hypothetical protein ABHF04_02390 [Pediococcus acidilactici]|uniref:hypothetical protein n=1 Tax=Pediococcus acidilactici TaxID=1254 RepID=UPI003263A0B5
MKESENVKEALAQAIEIAEGEELKIKIGKNKYRTATAEDVQDLIKERLYEIADFLGMEDLY